MKKYFMSLLLLLIGMTHVAIAQVPYAVLSDDGKTVTFYYDKQKAKRSGVVAINDMMDGYHAYNSITTAVFDTSFADYRPTSTQCWFYHCAELTTITGIENLKTENVTDMSYMFYGCRRLTSLALSSFKTDNVTNMRGMFMDCYGLTSLDLSGLNNEKVTDMSHMFYNCSGLTSLNLSGFNTANVTDMSFMFLDCKALTNLDVSGFNTDNVTNMEQMFDNCSGLTSLDLSSFNTSNVTDMTYMFHNCSSLMTIYASDGWSTEKLEYVGAPPPMFGLCRNLVGGVGTTYNGYNDINYARIDGGETAPGYFTDGRSYAVLSDDNTVLTFYYDNQKTSRNGMGIVPFNATLGPWWYPQHETITTVVFDKSFANNTSFGSTMGWFFNCSKLTTIIGIENLNTANVTNMSRMFEKCSSLTNLDLSGFKTDNVKYMNYMFCDCSSLTSLDLSGFNTGNVTTMEYMFFKCKSLKTIYVGDDWSVENVKNGDNMFYSCWPLVGGQGTTYGFDHNDHTYAHVDGGTANPGYLTNINAPKVDVTLTAKSYTRKYGEANPTFEYTVSNGTITSGTPTITCSATATSPVGTYDIVISKGTVSNSGTVNLVKGTLTITKAPLTISAGNYTKKEGEDNPEFAPVFTGFKNNETKAVLTKQPVVTTTATKASKEGNYTVSVSGAEAQNYNISYQTGTLTVTTSSTPVTNAEAYAVLSDDGKTVTFYYDDKKTSRTGVQEIHKYNNSNPYSTATKAVFDASFAEYLPTRTTYLFARCDKLTSITGMEHLNTANVTDMCSMFSGCSSLTSLDVSKFKTDKVKDMRFMFDRCSSLTSLDISNFNTSNVTSIGSMFNGCSSLTSLDVSNFNTVNVTSMSCMFYGCSSLPLLDVSGFNTSNVTNMSYMFDGCSSLTSLDVSNFNTVNVTSMSHMFSGCSSLPSLDVSNFNTVNVTSMSGMFSGCSSLPLLDVSGFNTSNVTNMQYMFSGCSSLTSLDVSNFNTSNVTNMQYMFSGCSSLPSLDVSNFNTHKVMYLNDMFRDCHSLTSLDVSNFNTTNVTNIGFMFYGCNSLTSLDLSNFNTSNVKYMYGMFWRCSSLKSLDLSNFNTVNVTDMHSMFLGCSSLTSLDISNFNTSNVTNMETMFSDCSSMSSLDVSNFNTTNVTNMSGMFDRCSSLTSLDVSNFNTSNVTNMRYMFFGCRSLKTIYTGENWTTDAVTSSERMFYNCTALVGGVGTAYDASHTDATYARIDGGTANPGYFTDINAPKVDVTLTAKSYTREYGEANPKFEWTISDGTVTSGTPTITCSATATSPVGTYDIVISKGTVGNNGTVNLVKGTLTITKAPLTVAAGNYTKEEGEDNPEFTPVFTGFKNNETKAALTKLPVVTTTATKASKAGSYPVTVSGAEAQNYSITYENGTLIVTEKEAPKVDVTLTAKSYTREYGEANPKFEWTVSDGTVTSGTPTITCSATATSPVGTYDIVISKGTVGNNGTVTLVKGTLTITKAPVTITTGNYTKEEGEDNPEFTPVFTGFKNNETETVLTKQPVITTTATKDSPAGDYEVTVSGAEAQNYSFSYQPGTLTVTAKPAELEPIEGETSMNTDDLRGQDLSDNVVGNIYYVVGENGYDASDQSIVISQPTNMSQIANREPGSADVKENFNGMILKVAKGKGLITVNVKTSGNAQLVVQVGNGTPMLASKTEKGDVVFRYDVEEDTYVYIYAIIGSSAAKGYGINAADTESSVRIYGITVSPGATGIRSIGASEKNDGNIYDLQGHRVETPAKGIYIIGGRKVAVK